MESNKIKNIKNIMCNDLDTLNLSEEDITDYCLKCAKYLIDNLEVPSNAKNLALKYLESLEDEDYNIIKSEVSYDKSAKDVTPELCLLLSIVESVKHTVACQSYKLYGANQMAFKLIEGNNVTDQSVDFLDEVLKSLINK